jgi:hypothetical protein
MSVGRSTHGPRLRNQRDLRSIPRLHVLLLPLSTRYPKNCIENSKLEIREANHEGQRGVFRGGDRRLFAPGLRVSGIGTLGEPSQRGSLGASRQSKSTVGLLRGPGRDTESLQIGRCVSQIHSNYRYGLKWHKVAHYQDVPMVPSSYV